MPSNSAAYMRNYRAKKKAERTGDVRDVLDDLDRMKAGTGTDFAARRIADLEEEVRHLKRELAATGQGARDSAAMQRNLDADIARFNTRPFTPVPKPGR